MWSKQQCNTDKETAATKYTNNLIKPGAKTTTKKKKNLKVSALETGG